MKMPVLAKILVVIIIGGIGIAIHAAWNEFHRTKRIELEVAKLQAEADRVKRENMQLSDRIAYFGTQDFEEREAKDKLGYKRADETVVGIQIADDVASREIATSNMHNSRDMIPIYKKWIAYFFPQEI